MMPSLNKQRFLCCCIIFFGEQGVKQLAHVTCVTRNLFGLKKIPLRFTRTTIEFIFTRKDIRQSFRGSSRNPHHTGTRRNTHNFQFTLTRVKPERVDLLFCLILPFVPLASKLLSKACSSTLSLSLDHRVACLCPRPTELLPVTIFTHISQHSRRVCPIQH